MDVEKNAPLPRTQAAASISNTMTEVMPGQVPSQLWPGGLTWGSAAGGLLWLCQRWLALAVPTGCGAVASHPSPEPEPRRNIPVRVQDVLDHSS